MFFVLGGFFLRPVQPGGWLTFFKKRIFPLLITYFFSGAILILLSHYIRDQSWSYTAHYFVRLVYGGRTLNHYLSVFWYINVYILTLLFVSLIITFVKNREYQIIIAFVSLIIGSSYKHMGFLTYKYLPWDFDVTLITVFFMFFGYLYFHKIQELVKDLWFVIPAAMITLWLVLMQRADQFNFGFFLKSRLIHASYHHIAISRVSYITIIPILVSLVVFAFCYYLSEYVPQFIVKPIQVLGQHTLGIMYLHKAMIDILGNMGVNGDYVKALLALLISFVISYAFNSFYQSFKNPKTKAVS